MKLHPPGLQSSLFAALVAVFLCLAGCATLTDGDRRNDLAAELAIKYATLKVIDNDSDPSERAGRIISIAEKTQSLVDRGLVSLIPEIEQVVKDQIDWGKLDAADTLLVDALLTAVRVELDSRVQGGALSGETALAVSRVLDSVIAAARLYVPD